MGDRGHVLDHADLQAGSLQRTDRSFTTGTGAFYIYFNGFQSMFHRSFGSSFRSRLRGKRSRFSGASEAQTAGACPAERITLYIGNGHDGIVESGLDMSRTAFDILTSHGVCGWLFLLQLLPSQLSLPDYFFLLAIVFFGPLRVRALVLVRCPLTGRPFL